MSELLADFLDLDAFAAQVARHPRTVHRWRNEPDGLPSTKMGNRILIHVPTAREWLLGKMKPPNPRRTARRGRAA
jgi:hypothetical protein